MIKMLMVMKEMPGVLFAILQGFGKDLLKNWWRWIFTFLATFCIIGATTPVGLPPILEIPWGIAIIILTVSAVLMPAWKIETLKCSIESMQPKVLGQET
jgi:hypothetical protein